MDYRFKKGDIVRVEKPAGYAFSLKVGTIGIVLYSEIHACFIEAVDSCTESWHPAKDVKLIGRVLKIKKK